MLIGVFFFFQAEDGIRSSSTSSGLGDVYQRQRDTLQQGISKIYATQESVVRSNYQLQSGRLLTSLSKHSYSSSITGESYICLLYLSDAAAEEDSVD